MTAVLLTDAFCQVRGLNLFFFFRRLLTDAFCEGFIIFLSFLFQRYSGARTRSIENTFYREIIPWMYVCVYIYVYIYIYTHIYMYYTSGRMGVQDGTKR
jgi:hypothetical protein